jgi:hypothetical protein
MGAASADFMAEVVAAEVSEVGDFAAAADTAVVDSRGVFMAAKEEADFAATPAE